MQQLGCPRAGTAGRAGLVPHSWPAGASRSISRMAALDPELPNDPAPSMVRSLASVVSATDQPSPRPPIWLSAARAASVRNTSLKIDSAGHLPDGPNLDAGLVHLDDEVGQPGVLGYDRGRSGRPGSVAGDVGTRRPHLLAVDDPLLAVTLGPGLKPGQVGAGPGLGEQLAPDLAGDDAGQQAGLLLGRAVGDDGRAGQVLGDAGGRRRHPRVAAGVGDQAGGVPGQAPAVGPLRPCGEPPPGLGQAPRHQPRSGSSGPVARTRPWPRA